MADIAVSSLIQQIENHVKANRSAQALALCTHILYYFPKHLETYSLMAQALTVEGNLDGALDLYRRVLSADPENPGAYAGLAHIFDARRHVEEALWHMERAYELAPAQPEIRQELLRLYGQHEAAPRERLKLTRGALARLYVQEGLYDQAIHEFREIGSTTLSRYDIRIALAEAMWRAGRTRDAADVAQSLLDALPYCLKANLILGTAWHESAIPENQKYLERAVSLEPSNQVAQKMLGARSPLRVTTVTLPEYVEGAPPPYAAQREPPQAEPFPLAPLTEEDKALAIFDTPVPAPTVEPRPESVAAISPLPAAMVEPPRQVIAEKIEPALVAFAPPQEPKPSILNPDLPPWLHSDAALPVESAAAESSSSGAASNPEWLAQLRRNFSDEPEEEKGIPAELIPMPVNAEPEPPPEPEQPPVTQEAILPEPAAETRAETAEEIIPAWLSAKAETVDEESESTQAPAWLSEPTPVRAETPAATSETRVPKWVEVLSRRESETIPPAEEKIPARLEPPAPAAEIAQPEPLARLEPTAPATQVAEPAPLAPAQPVTPFEPAPEPRTVHILPEPMPPVAEHAKPAPPIAIESSAPATQVAEPAPPVVVASPPASIGETPAQPTQKRQPEFHSRLAQAREYRNSARITDALTEYEFVINDSTRLVSEAILDLEALVAKGDAPLDAHRLLGDAYTRAGRLNDALERYRYVKRQTESKS